MSENNDGRAFRTEASLRSEKMARVAVPEILRQRGFRVLSDTEERNGQSLKVADLTGATLTFRTKLCWRWDEERATRSTNNLRYSASQLMARISGEDWENSIRSKIEREIAAGSTHYLFVQMENETVAMAASLPLTAVAEVWVNQRDVSARLIQSGALGRRKKNHAMNGRSPTIWLRDDRGGRDVADQFWKHPDAVDVLSIPKIEPNGPFPDDLDPLKTYIEGAARRVVVNAYERDERARAACIEFHGSACCVCGISFDRVYGHEAKGLIHVHHLHPLSEPRVAHVVDPVADLRPVCPNCHAVIHYGGECRSIDAVKAMLRHGRTE